jgi:riboflavin kinase/FMN adenylyltransferase
MQVITGYQNLKSPLSTPIITLGNFDGVHLGHQRILFSIQKRAQELGGTSVVYTFHPHPLAVLAEGNQPLAITTFEEKFELIETCGIDIVICEPFTMEFSRITADQFGQEILCKRIGAKEIYVGEDYKFGSKRQGDIHYLKKLGRTCDFRVRIVESIVSDAIIVKSSKIRQFIQMGEMPVAERLLGRAYHIRGQVVKGKGRGAALGFPTANLKPNKSLYPAEGVYAVWVFYQGQRFMGAMNIGKNPTFDDQVLSLEVYIMDFDKRIYDDDVEVRFVKRIRREQTFQSPEALVKQMHKDVDEIRRILEREEK